MTFERVELLDIARQGVGIGAELLETAETGHVRTKGDRDFVTDLDVPIQSTVRGFLGEVTPGIGFLGEEEQGAVDAAVIGGAVWVLDPIDGTSNFIHGVPLSAVSLALVEEGVAEGRTDGCVIHSNKPWDTAAGVLIARESGAVVTDSGGRVHEFGSADTVAAAPGIQGELLELIRVSGL